MATKLQPQCTVVGTPVSYGLETFKDRREQVRQILEWLADPGTRLITVFGRRGIGKSALAAKVAQILATSSRECRGVANLSTRMGNDLTIERIFFTCAEMAGPAKKAGLDEVWASRRSPQDKLLLLFAALQEGMYLIILDNIESQLSDNGRLQADNLGIFLDVVFRAVAAPRVLVTSQVPISLDPAMRRMEARLHLKGGLPVDDCVSLLRDLDRNGDAGLLDAPATKLELAATRLHGVPRALELAVGALADDHLTLPSLDEVLKDFTARGDIVDQLAHSRHSRLDEESRMTLDVLAVFGTPVTREPVEWVMQPLAPGVDPVRALSQLADIHMVAVNRKSKEFSLHPLDADIAYGALPTDGPFSRRVLERRVAAWFESLRVPPPWRSVSDVANHRLEYDHRLRANDYDECALILDEIGGFLLWQGSTREVADMHLTIHDHLRADVAVLAHLIGYGQAKHIGGPVEEAIQPLQQAVALAERMGDERQLERALLSLGSVFRGLRRLNEAIEVLRRTAEVAAHTGNVLQQSGALLSLSLSLSYLGDVPGALDVADQLSRLADRSGDPLIAGRTGDARSAAYIVASRWSQAVTAAEEAVQAYEAANAPEHLGYARNAAGIGLLGEGRVDAALDSLSRGRDDCSGAGSPRAEGLCLYNLSWAYWMAGNYDAVKDAAQNAVEVLHRAGGPDLQASEKLAAAAAAMANGNRKLAGEALAGAVEAARGNSDLAPSKWLLTEAALLRRN
jgi:tetratricopeptide (TPR) repeat protein